MVDAAGTSAYAYTSGGLPWKEDGPWASDTVTNIYKYRMRTNLTLLQPTGTWTNRFGYDATKALTEVASPGGTFTYTLGAVNVAGPLPKKITLGNTSYITNTYDSMARLTGTYLKTSGNGKGSVPQIAYRSRIEVTQLLNRLAALTYGYAAGGQLWTEDLPPQATARQATRGAATP